MNKLKLKYVKICFKDENIVVFADEGDVDHFEIKANCSETSIIVTTVYNLKQNEIRHEDIAIYKTKDIAEIVQRWK